MEHLAVAQRVVRALVAESLGSAAETVESVVGHPAAETATTVVLAALVAEPVPVGLGEDLVLVDSTEDLAKCTQLPAIAVATPVRFHSVQTAASQFIAVTVSRKTTHLLSVRNVPAPLPSALAVIAAETVAVTASAEVVNHATADSQKSVCSKQNVPSVTANAKCLSDQTEKSLSTAARVLGSLKLA